MRSGFFTECFFVLVLELAAFVVAFEVMVGCPFLDSRAAGRGRGVVRWEIARFVVNRLAPADFRSVAYLGPPYRAFDMKRQLARHRVARGRSGATLVGSTAKV